MELAVGTILDGKVKSITNFGAFVSLPEGKSGLVHISEIASTFVSNIRDHLTEGQEVKVRVLTIDPAGKISLSIRRAVEADASAEKKPFDRSTQRKPFDPAQKKPFSDRKPQQSFKPAAPKEPLTFEEKLKQYMSDADSNLASNRMYADRRTKTRRR